MLDLLYPVTYFALLLEFSVVGRDTDPLIDKLSRLTQSLVERTLVLNSSRILV